MAMKDPPITRMMMQNSARIICLNEADAFLSLQDEKSKDLIKTFIRFGYKGIVIKQWSSKPIACFVRGGPSARVELLARHISTRSQNWGTTFGMLTSRPLTAWQPQEHPCSGNPRNTLDRDCRHAQLSKDMGATRKLSSSTSSKVMNFVACFQSHPMIHSSNSTAAEGRPPICYHWSFSHPSINQPWSSTGRFSIRNHAARDIV